MGVVEKTPRPAGIHSAVAIAEDAAALVEVRGEPRGRGGTEENSATAADRSSVVAFLTGWYRRQKSRSNARDISP